MLLILILLYIIGYVLAYILTKYWISTWRVGGLIQHDKDFAIYIAGLSWVTVLVATWYIITSYKDDNNKNIPS